MLSGSCKYEEPVLTTNKVGEITQTAAAGGGEINDDGGREIISRGLVWCTNADPDIEEYTGMTIEGPGEEIFFSKMTGLLPNTTYYVRAYATNSVGTAYGMPLQFTTAPTIATLTTRRIDGITQTGASSGGSITDNGGAAVTYQGLVWSTSENPTLYDNQGITRTDEETDDFAGRLTGLQHSTNYFVRAYATNSVGTAYGNQISFSTLSAVRPTVTTVTISCVTVDSAISGGNITSSGGAEISARGVVISTSQNPVVEKNEGITTDGDGIGEFTSEIGGLTGGTNYYIRAYATNTTGTAYGDELVFTTDEPEPPVVTIIEPLDFGATTATGLVHVKDDGGAEITARGVVWNTFETPYVDNYDGITEDGKGTGEFTSEITGLKPGRGHYLRAYAINSAGTSYSEQVFFTTKVTTPTVITSGVTNIKNHTAVSEGTITDDGGAEVTAGGVVWSTLGAPDTDNYDGITTDDIVTDGIDTDSEGEFISELTGLRHGTTYYVRAYAINSAGIAYGNQMEFTTGDECGTDVSFTYGGEKVTYGTVTGANGACWMDRNLGALQVAVSRRDSDSYGDLFQWGRPDDGHQDRSSDITSRLSENDRPGHDRFIISREKPYDWRASHNNSLWQDDNGNNDVCPAGWRLPTAEELYGEMSSWSRNNRRGAFESPLKMPASGLRSNDNSLLDNGRRGYYWSSEVDGSYSKVLIFSRRSALLNISSRAGARSVRCIRDD